MERAAGPHPHTALIELFEASVRQFKNAARAWQLVGIALLVE
ncbi:hypothetical protein [Sinorhizobium meliloti]|nr:hypothetical protein [Sinorhizobium meliloti]